LSGLKQILAEIQVDHLVGIVATHSHPDHTQGFKNLAQAYSVPLYIHPLDIEPACAATSLSASAWTPVPDTLWVGAERVVVEHHPGHTHGHLHLLIPSDDVILVGDHLATDGSVWIGPPDGHIESYYSALLSIENSGFSLAGPGHGRPILDAAGASRTLLARRQAREAEIIRLISAHPQTLASLLETLYQGHIPESAMWVAKKTLQAHVNHAIQAGHIKRVYAPDAHLFYYHAVTGG
jgi:glyoxylase-like metal-dependent hydrolase (beta-lactamase superfamily II)